jgi:CRP-like cAMP-binding protein
MTVLTQEPATGTAIATEPTRCWSIDARVLRSLVEAEPEILTALRIAFAANLREKLVISNQATLEQQRPHP